MRESEEAFIKEMIEKGKFVIKSGKVVCNGVYSYCNLCALQRVESCVHIRIQYVEKHYPELSL